MGETSESQYQKKRVLGLQKDKELRIVAICQGKDYRYVFTGERE